ncbi:MAG: ornithine carbamoyltransferase [Nitrospina sp.]|jgi:ornithine carbamoyltransferase|nr:ornithine carbamoyltransferase [Nitrospina sp.]MBT5632313.1 ornithine carbamoyltransferase [Nitrospina sp.]
MKKDLLAISDCNHEEILALFEKSADLKEKRQKGIQHLPLKGKTLGMIFNKHSTRTRISFEVGMFELGGHALFLTGDQLQLNRGETIKDSAQVLSRYLNGILIRTYDHQEVVALAEHASIPVINGLTDFNHPLQILSDIFTIKEKLGHIEGVKIAYVGDGNNVAYSWMAGASLMGMNLVIASPKSLQPSPPPSLEGNGKVEVVEDPFEAVKNADVIYTDVWISMGDEEDAENKKKLLLPYQINQKLVDSAKEDVMVMHCLPAHRDMEITSEVLDGEHSIVFDQAENRLHVQKAILETLLLKPTK